MFKFECECCVFLMKKMATILKLGDFMVEIQKSKSIILHKTKQFYIGQGALINYGICVIAQHNNNIVQC
jgi:hypothetical protein